MNVSETIDETYLIQFEDLIEGQLYKLFPTFKDVKLEVEGGYHYETGIFGNGR